MAVVNNVRQERFCLFLSERKTADEAYRLAGYEPDKGNPSHLMNKPAVKKRIQELTDALTRRVAAAQQITREKLVEWQNEIRQRGVENGQLAAASNATKEIGILTGHRVERGEVRRAPGEFDSMTDDELRRALVERLKSAGTGTRRRKRYAALIGSGSIAAIKENAILVRPADRATAVRKADRVRYD